MFGFAKKTIKKNMFDKKVLRKNDISLLILDERWNKLFANTAKTQVIERSEQKLRELLKEEARLTAEQKEIAVLKKKHLDNIIRLTPEVFEKDDEAAKREMFEESGLTALSLELFGVFSGPELFHKYPDGNEVHIIDIVFTCSDFVGDLRPQESEVLQLKWFDFDKLPENLSHTVKPALRKFLEQQHTVKV
jgi:hypothetical protein